MSDTLPTEELRQSASLVATEWWLFIGGLAVYLVYGGWVVATGIALAAVVPATTLTTVGGTAVTATAALAAVLWLLVPAVVATWLFERRLGNAHGNLLSHYRVEPPGTLVALPAVAVLVVAIAAAAVGPRPSVVGLGVVASTHLLVRTVAYGRRVYSFSPRRLFTLLSAVSAVSLAAGWLVHAPRLPGAAGRQVARADVGSLVGTGTAIAGTTPATALGALVAVPALLSVPYLLVQNLAARRVRARAPLADPDKRAEQRFPIMPPVPATERPGVTVREPSGPPTDGTDDDDDQPTEAADEPEPAEADEQSVDPDPEPGEDKSQTRVFTADEPVPDGDAAPTQLADETGGALDDETADADDEDDGWIDDTSVFSPDRGSGDSGECESCGEPLPADASVTFCPNCGQKI